MKLGKVNILQIARKTDFGFFLEDDSGNEVLMPNAYIDEKMRISDEIEVFLYRDSEDRITATTLKPFVQLNEFAWLRVNEVNKYGAFLDWGLPKELLVPYARQTAKMVEGNYYLIYLLLDEKTDRLVGSTKVNRYLETNDNHFDTGEEVNILAYEVTELGTNVIVNNRFRALVFHSDNHRNIRPGDKTKAFVKNVREDKKIDISLAPPGYHESIKENTGILISALKENEGYLNMNDNSDPAEIRTRLGMSKKAFKRTIGKLYRDKLIKVTDKGIQLSD